MLAFLDMKLSPSSNAAHSWVSRNQSPLGTVREASPQRSAERGAGHLKAIIWTLILASLVYVAFKVMPTLIGEYQFKDGIQDIAREASVNRKTPEQIRQAVLKEAEKDGLPVEAGDIKVELPGKSVHISADIAVTVDLSVYKWTLNFHPEASNDALF